MKKSLIETMSLLTINKGFAASCSSEKLNIESMVIHPTRVNGFLVRKEGDVYGYSDESGNFVRTVFYVPKALAEKGMSPLDFGSIFVPGGQLRTMFDCIINRLIMKMESVIDSVEGDGASQNHDLRKASFELVAEWATAKEIVDFRNKQLMGR